MNKPNHIGSPEWEQILRALSNREAVSEDRYAKLSDDEKLLISELQETQQLNIYVNQLDEIDVNKDWLSVKSRLTQGDKKNRTVKMYSKWLRYAAVMLLPIMLIGLYFLSKQDAKLPSIANVNKTKDGYKKATLILSDGSSVELGANKAINNLDGTQVFDDQTNALTYTKIENVNTTPTFNTLIIPKGNEYKLILADGTEVWVNADTRIKYQVNLSVTKTREVFLESGEAFFKVAKNPNKPFIVHHKNMNVQVLGTSFNINAYSNTVQTTLTEGKVNVSIDNGKQQLELAPDQQANFNLLTKTLEKEDVDVYSFVAWKDGVFALENETMENLMARIGRLYDYDIAFKDESLKHLHYSGSMNKPQDVRKIINIIQKTSNLKLTLKERTIIVEKSTKK